jgi:rRNA-processing protein FCF1
MDYKSSFGVVMDMHASTAHPLIAFDTNFLLDMVRLKIDIFDQIHTMVGKAQLVVSQPVRGELESLSLKKDKNGMAARVALVALDVYGVKTLPTKAQTGDASLKELAKAKEAIIATSDAKLKQSLKNAPQGVLVIRQSKYVDWA